MTQHHTDSTRFDAVAVPATAKATTSALTITRITHSCTLLDFGGTVLLADPWFSEKFGYHRGEPLGMSPNELPPLSALLISHSHYDHNDVKSIADAIDKRVPMLVEAQAANSARKLGFENVTMLAPWQHASIGDVRVTAVPAKHGVPEIGFVVQGLGFTVYFGGDTLLIPDLSEIAQRFPNIDVALLPINGLHVFGKQVAMNPVEAAGLCATLRPTTAIPTHYAFNGGLTDGIMLKYYADQGKLPNFFREALIKYAPDTRAVVLAPAEAVTIQPYERKAP